MSSDLVLARLDQARVALAEASTIPEVKRFVDLAATAETWARQQKLGEEIVGYAHKFKVDALWRLGEMLRGTERRGPQHFRGGGSKGSKREPLPGAPPAFSDLGVDKKLALTAQRLAQLPPERLERVRSGKLPVGSAVREVSRAEKAVKLAETTPNLEAGAVAPVPLLYADPPWQYEHPISDSRRIENQYPTMTVEQLCDYPAWKLATDDAVLFLWATNPKLREALTVMEAWGFTYRTNLAWVKDRIGMGYWVRQRHELLLLGVRGNPPTPLDKPDSVIEAARGKHSQKPVEAYERIERMFPEWADRRIELFARKARPGWKAVGNEL